MQRIQVNTSKNLTRRRVYLSGLGLSIGGNGRQRLAGEIVNHTQDAEAAILQDSRIMVLATHSNELIKQTCNKVLVLEGGSQVYFGDIDGWDFERASKIDDAGEQLSVPQVIGS